VLYPYTSAELFYRYCRLNGTLARTDVEQYLTSVKQPTLVVTSEDDETAHPQGSRQLAEGLPNAYLRVEAHGDHASLFHADSTTLMQAAVDFIEAHSGPPDVQDQVDTHERGRPMSDYIVRPLGPDTWDAFAAPAERHNGVWNGCWCTYFHPTCPEPGQSQEVNRGIKERLVNEGVAHAALVFDGDRAVAWCEYGTPEELPNVQHNKQYLAELDILPDYRITCFFVDRDYRRQGMARVALDGALHLIAQAGGGVVESYPQDTDGKKTSASFLYNATRSLFEQAGFTYIRSKGIHHSVMRKTVPATRATSTRKRARR
jgi:GNAT superfamily N-acetyltransferase